MLKKYPTEIDFQLKTINLNNDRSFDIYANSLFVMRICHIRDIDDDFRGMFQLIISAYGRRNGGHGNFIFPIVNLKYNNASDRYGECTSPNYFLAIKELVIEWSTNYQSNANNQAEECGYIHCDGIQDVIAENPWSEYTKIHKNEKESQNMKDLFRFVKLPGRKSSHFKITPNEANLVLLDLKKFKQYPKNENRYDVELEMKSIFGDRRLLPVKHAYITVEIHIRN